mmetsp:Transcript_56335/g.111953  ORF Transcript_56335/g.111953 Transcript_56335/m.111953 type:complete len:247 (+) Transcript_56335:921-1661(+)
MSPSKATGAWPPVWTCEIQSKRTARILPLASLSHAESRCRGRSISKNTLHLADATSAALPLLVSLLPHMSSSSNTVFMASAEAKDSAPASPMALSRKESLRIGGPDRKTAAIAMAPALPIPLLPRLSSPMEGFVGFAKAQATARAPRLPRDRPLISSDACSGGAEHHCRPLPICATIRMRTRSPNVGRKSMISCSSSTGRSSSRMSETAGFLTATGLGRLQQVTLRTVGGNSGALFDKCTGPFKLM